MTVLGSGSDYRVEEEESSSGGAKSRPATQHPQGNISQAVAGVDGKNVKPRELKRATSHYIILHLSCSDKGFLCHPTRFNKEAG